MTGEIFKIATVPFQDGPYQPENHRPPPTSPLPIRAVILSTGGAGFPYVVKRIDEGEALASPWPSLLFVITMCDVDGGVVSLTARADLGGSFTAWIQTGNGQVSVSLLRVGGGFVNAVFNYAGTNRLTNFIIYANSTDEVVQLAVGDTVIAPASVTWSGSGDFSNPSTIAGSPAYWMLTSFLTAHNHVRIVRFWATSVTGGLDLTDTATRRPFVTAAGVPAPLPEDGSVAPYGVPTDYLHARVSANDFVGSGLRAWTIVDGPLEFDLAACFMP